jgi:hypothetical protein
LKERYPLIPIERYEWRRENGRTSTLDPHHERSAARSWPRESMTIRAGGGVAGVTGMSFPGDGSTSSGARRCRRDGIGTHVEPNVWVLHRVD